jgi:hypothetical protein
MSSGDQFYSVNSLYNLLPPYLNNFLALIAGLRFKQPQNLLDHLPVFQADGQEDGFH